MTDIESDGAIMALYLVRHGANLPAHVDPDKGLSEEGRKEVEGVAASAGGYALELASIRHSGKKRAYETAQILESALKSREGVQEMSGLGPNDDFSRLAATMDRYENTMFVGHLPFMERLVACLVNGSPGIPAVRFRTGQMVCLEKDSQSGSWVIQWALTPDGNQEPLQLHQ
jgi:phosphohistidine phosphatase